MDKIEVLREIKSFLDGYNNDLKYLVNVETDNKSNMADCVIHEPGKESKIVKIKYEPFMYMKDLEKLGIILYQNKCDEIKESMKIKHGITITKLKTGNQKRLVDGYCYKIVSTKSYNDIVNYLKDGGIDIYEKVVDENTGETLKDKRGDDVYKHRDLFYAPKTTEQFFISNKCRLYKGIEEYKNVHKLTFDIETTGLRYQIARVFAIGVRDNRGFETILEAKKLNDDESEIKLIQDFFYLIDYLRPAVISGYNSEDFDFEFLLGRAKILGIDINLLPTSLNSDIKLKRNNRATFKHGSTAEKYTSTIMWGYSVIDISHAAKKTAAINSDIKNTKLKYIAKHEGIAKSNRTYVKGEDNTIGKIFEENKIFVINDNNEYIQIPEIYQETGKKLYKLQANKENITAEQYGQLKKKYLDNDKEFVTWFKETAISQKMNKFIGGKNLVKQYLLDDLWETEQVDELYNQSSFMLAKIIPTTYSRICTMGTAAIWNLVMTAWSYENDLAIPHTDINEKFSGGLARCFKTGYSKRIVKIDYASLYPMIQLTEDVFPMFDITGVIKKLLLYLTTTRNIYKKLANGDELNVEETILLKEIDNETYEKYINKAIKPEEWNIYKIKQLPIKILNNSLFGALGSGISFNWSDNQCAARITCTGRLHLRHAISWFSNYKLIPLLAVTDGINFSVPDKTTIKVVDNEVLYDQQEGLIEDMWKFGNKQGVAAIIDKYNYEVKIHNESRGKTNYISVDNDGESISCLNLSRINYATMSIAKNKKTKESYEKIKLTGNTIKSKTMPEYIEDFIDKGLKLILQGKGKEFVEYYQNYATDIRYMQIPLKKIASKSKIKTTISNYYKRGKDKNGKDKAIQAHMELLIESREKMAEELFEKHKDQFILKNNYGLDAKAKMKYVANYMPQEPALDSMIYYVNCGYKKSHGDSKRIVDKKTGKERFCAIMISNDDLADNPDMVGEYNYEKYLDAFNTRVETLLAGFDPEIAKKILVTLDKKGELKTEMFTNEQLELKNFDLDPYDEAMTLEEMEVLFWNRYRFDPRQVWDGFKIQDDFEHTIFYEIYDNALNYLNDLMVKNNKPKIKSINEPYNSGDFVLIKDNNNYKLGKYNGTFLEIIKNIDNIPKSDIEIELNKRQELREEKIKNLEVSSLANKTEAEVLYEKEFKLREVLFDEFKQKYEIPMQYTMSELFNSVENSSVAFDDYVDEYKESHYKQEEDFADNNDDVDDTY